MKRVRVDAHKRVRIPAFKPGQVVTYRRDTDGTILLIPDDRKDRFPRGSLAKYFTAEKNAEETAILSGCVQGPL